MALDVQRTTGETCAPQGRGRQRDRRRETAWVGDPRSCGFRFAVRGAQEFRRGATKEREQLRAGMRGAVGSLRSPPGCRSRKSAERSTTRRSKSRSLATVRNAAIRPALSPWGIAENSATRRSPSGRSPMQASASALNVVFCSERCSGGNVSATDSPARERETAPVRVESRMAGQQPEQLPGHVAGSGGPRTTAGIGAALDSATSTSASCPTGLGRATRHRSNPAPARAHGWR